MVHGFRPRANYETNPTSPEHHPDLGKPEAALCENKTTFLYLLAL